MVRGALSFGGIVLAAGVSVLFGLQESGRLDLGGVFRPLPEIDSALQRGFRSDAMVQANRVRLPAGVGEVRGDESIQGFLETFVSSQAEPEKLELDEVFDVLQGQFPGAQYLAANLITARSRDDLLSKLGGWTALANPDFDSIATSVFRAGSGLGALGVMSRCIPEFSLGAANAGGGRFHNRCPHCGEVHALELDRDSRTLILSCPHCDLPFDVLATGSSGDIRRAQDFLEGFSLEEGIRTEGDGKATVLALWGRVADRCEYELDQDYQIGGADPGLARSREVWKRSSETWNDARGDCEDTAILLADVLIGAGFEARVAIGWNGNIGQHAWTVVKLGDEQFLLESTLQKKIGPEDLVPVAESAAFYQPEQLFDRERLYYTTARPERFGSDYFSEAVWKAVPFPVSAGGELTQR